MLIVMPFDDLKFDDNDDSTFGVDISSRFLVDRKTIELLTFAPPMRDSSEIIFIIADRNLTPHCARLLQERIRVPLDSCMILSSAHRALVDSGSFPALLLLDPRSDPAEVILNGDSPVPTRVIDGIFQPVAPTTAEQRLARKNKLKARGTLLIALPDKHQLKFNTHKGAKTLIEAIEKRFRGNTETTKVRKTFMKQQYENFTSSSSESLDQIHDRLQKLISQLEILRVSLLQEDINLNLKIYEDEVKSSSSTSTTTQNIAFVSSSNTDSTNEPVSIASSVSVIDADDLEEMDLKWQMAMLTVECYNCHRKGHFVRKCRSLKDTRMNGVAEPQRRNVPVETSTSNALVSLCNGVCSYDWSFQAEEEPTNYALMAFSSSSYSSDNELRDNTLVSHRKNIEKAEQERDDLKLKLEKFQTSFKNLTELLASQTNAKTCLGYNSQVFTRAMFACDDYLSSGSDDSLPSSPIYDRYKSGNGYHAVPLPYTGTFMPPKLDLVFNKAPNDVETDHPAFNVKLSPTKPEQDLSYTFRPSALIIEDWVSDSEDESETKPLQNVLSFVQPTEQVKSPMPFVQHVETSIPLATPKTAIPKPTSIGKHKNRKACFVNHSQRGTHKQYAQMTLPNPQRHLVPAAVFAQSKPVPITAFRPVSTAVPKISVTRPRQANPVVTKTNSPPRRHITCSPSPKASNSPSRVTAVKALMVNAAQGNPQHALKDKGVIDSGCSRHMTGNMSYLSDFKEHNDGYVAFEATIDELNLWHRRLGHINFKTMNTLVKGNLVRGLATKVFENDNTCVACKKGKQHRASCKTKPVSSINQPLYRLQIDLFRPTFVKSMNKKSYCLIVINDYSRFTWVFFLATKDETSPILKTFITGLENQLSLKVKVIRSDNGTEFKNHDLNQFCRMKGIKREFSIPRTPQQNGIAKRKNRTFIEAPRIMLVDSFLPILFWAEVVNTACYVQNKVLVTKPQNKTPYELLHGRKPSIGFMRPFGCLVTILNTLDSLGKFDGKVDEGFLVGYSVSSKAFRVFNSKTRIVQETLHVNFLENKPNVPEKAREESDQQYVLFHVRCSGFTNLQNTNGDAAFDEKEPEFDEKKHEYEVNVSPSSSAQSKKHDDKTKKEAKGKIPVVGQISLNSTNTFSAAGPSNAVVSPTHRKFSFIDTFKLPDDPDMPELEDITYSDNEDDVGAEADFNNLETSITFSLIPTTRVHKDHPVAQIIGDLSSATHTRSTTRVAKDQGGLSQINNEDFHTCMFACFLSQEEPNRVHQALKDPSWIEAMQEELLQFKMQKVWVLVDLRYGKELLEEGIDYEEVFAPVARIEAIRLFLAYASFMGFMVYQMDVKSAFLYRNIEKVVYVGQPLGFEDPDHPNKVYKVVKALYGLHQAPRAWYETLANYLLENGFQRGKIDQTLFIKRQKGDISLVQIYVDDIIFGLTNKDLCKAFEKLMKDKFQMSLMGELTFFLGLQVKQKKNGIFISHDKYVAEILRKFGLTDRKSASTPIDTKKPLLKDPDGEDVDVHTYTSMIGSLMYLTSLRPDIMFAVCACARFQVTPKASHLHAVKRIFRYLKGKPHLGLWYPKDSPFDLVAYSDSDYVGASLDRKSTTEGCQFLRCRLIS
nr:hypothetical protein [Tanacetum cinerariifolium]